MATSLQQGNGLEGMRMSKEMKDSEIALAGYLVYARLTPGQGKFYPLLTTEDGNMGYELFGTVEAADDRILEEMCKDQGTRASLDSEDFIVKCLWWDKDEGNKCRIRANIEPQEVAPTGEEKSSKVW